MFSGIIEDTGVLVGVRPQGAGRMLEIETRLPVAPAGAAGVGRPDRERIGLGDSIAVLGACLTVEAVSPPNRFTVVAGAETVERTVIGALQPGARLHLERALRLGDRLDGHLVAGHVDGVGRVVSLAKAQESWVLWVEAPEALSRYVAEKGSIAIDGVSLTVNEVDGARFRVNIIPYTAVETRLGLLRPGDRVNLEADLIARYLERLLAGRTDAPAASLTADRLVALGFGPTRSTGRSS